MCECVLVENIRAESDTRKCRVRPIAFTQIDAVYPENLLLTDPRRERTAAVVVVVVVVDNTHIQYIYIYEYRGVAVRFPNGASADDYCVWCCIACI